MNRLKDATSPYLLQHANNPVDWYPWGEEALETARRDDKPILLSIGYSACHWCHVMAHESFEDPDTAAMMNRNFVCIKVDREERPDLDDIYMQATLMFNQGNGGWPMTVFLDPQGRPFHAGTYYPKIDRSGMPSFRRVMAAVLDAYHNRRDQVNDIANQVTEGLQQVGALAAGDDSYLNTGLLDKAYQGMVRNFDPINGGLSKGRPKFPGPMNLAFVLRTYAHTKTPHALEIVTFSLRKMARGGIYDQIGGGFHRYSVDERWLVPHFEKMLYDNAQLSRLYLHTWQASGDEFFKRIAVEIYDYILLEMTAPDGGFYSTTDADSEGEEGKFFIWTPDEIRAILPPEDADAASAYWGVTPEGNFEHRNILNVPDDNDAVAKTLGITVDELQRRIESAKHKLYAARTHRVHPGRDEKILTAWNGLMLASLAEAARALNRDDYKQAAIRNAEFLLINLYRDGRLLRSYRDGQSNFNGYLDDYANLIDGLLELYQTTYERRYFETAQSLTEVVLAHYAAPGGGFFDTSDDHESLITRPRNLQDNATPSGNSVMAKVLIKLTAYTGDGRYDDAARGILRQLIAAMEQYPTAFGEALNAADLLIRGIKEVAIIGDPSQPDTQSLLAVINSSFRPNMVSALSAEDVGETAVPMLLAYRTHVNGKSAAYVCEHFMCQRPVTDAEALRGLLES
ncbi:MAG: thioredoxin domain-containing protein [Anaerolineae bacterium]|nr:thioredoxin domain-containing protein [Anaerolineae bacterium]